MHLDIVCLKDWMDLLCILGICILLHSGTATDPVKNWSYYLSNINFILFLEHTCIIRMINISSERMLVEYCFKGEKITHMGITMKKKCYITSSISEWHDASQVPLNLIRKPLVYVPICIMSIQYKINPLINKLLLGLAFKNSSCTLKPFKNSATSTWLCKFPHFVLVVLIKYNDQ